MSIDPIPRLNKYPVIFNALKEKKAVIFLGAGVSALWGCKRWEDLARGLIDSCYEKDYINYYMKINLLEKFQYNPRKIVTISKNILGSEYISELKKQLVESSSKKKKNSNIFKALFALDVVFVSTNVDGIFAALFDKSNLIFRVRNFGIDQLRPGRLVQLHGNLIDPDSLVMTIEEYTNRYREEKMKRLLKYLFLESDYKIIFMGYGMDEMEIIDYLFEKHGDAAKKLIDKYYILLPIFYNETELLKHEIQYFQQMNISVVPYIIDEKGYDQLADIISEWSQEIILARERKKNDFYKFIDLIEENR